MKNKFEIGETVGFLGFDKTVEILDFEFFDGLILYYTSDGSAYPENKLTKIVEDDELSLLLLDYFNKMDDSFWELDHEDQ